MRYCVVFSKEEPMRYTSHLDLQRTWERIIRRAGLPLSYSQGFNPHPKLIIAAALPLGITSEFELLEIWLDEDLNTEQVACPLQHSVPPGIEIQKVDKVDLSSPKLPTLIESAVYEITFLELIPDLSTRLRNLLANCSLIRERRGKTYDLRPLINNLVGLLEDPSGRQRICVSLKNKPEETGRPDEVLSALNIDPKTAIIHRTNIILTNQEKNQLHPNTSA
jgi:radical SAM-linked protein